MGNRTLDHGLEIKPSLWRQVAKGPGEESELQGTPSLQRDPLDQVACRLGDASCAGAHASTLNRVTASQPTREARSVLQLQRGYGNRYVQRVLALARHAEGEAEAAPEVETAIQRERGSGQALGTEVRAQMEPALGADFGGVRVHAGGQADALNRSLNARAFTTGQDIFFKQGEYSPGSSGGRELLAHELTHVVQQRGDEIQRKLTLSQSGDRYEQAADWVARAMMQREPHLAPEGVGSKLVQRQPEEEEEDNDLTERAKELANGAHAVRPALDAAPGVQLQQAEETAYTVQPGDSLPKIAAKFGVNVQALKVRNAAKLKTWFTRRGNVQGFEAGETIVIPGSTALALPGEKPVEEEPARGLVEGVTEALKTAWEFWKEFFGGKGKRAPSPTISAPTTPVPTPLAPVATTCSPTDPVEVITCHNQLGTFGKGVEVRVTSTKRDQQKQLTILRNYCKSNRAALDEFAEKTNWLKGELDWETFKTCSLSDQEVWLPFFFALFYGGGGPGTKSEDRTLPLVASPVQAVWKGRTANVSPHLAGRAMDVKDGNLATLSISVKTKIPEFGKTGQFPVRSTQIESAAGQHVVHINFEKIVF